jgi:hypothetical protein
MDLRSGYSYFRTMYQHARAVGAGVFVGKEKPPRMYMAVALLVVVGT